MQETDILRYNHDVQESDVGIAKRDALVNLLSQGHIQAKPKSVSLDDPSGHKHKCIPLNQHLCCSGSNMNFHLLAPAKLADMQHHMAGQQSETCCVTCLFMT